MYVLPNFRRVVLSSAVLLLLGGASNAWGQGFLDGLRRQVEREIQNSIPRILPSNGLQPPGRGAPPFGSGGGISGGEKTRGFNSIPGEGGTQNNRNPFSNRDMFLPPGSNRTIINNPPANQGPIYSNPNPVYGNPTPIYGNPTQGNPSTGVPAYSNPRSSQSPPVAAEKFSNEMIAIRCPKSGPQSVRYTLLVDNGSFPFTIRPGEAQRFRENRRWMIRFQRGGAEQTYRLKGGNTYTFEMDASNQLQLFKETSTVSEPPMRSSH